MDKMWDIKYLLLITTLAASIHSNHAQNTGCQMEGVPSWFISTNVDVLDTDTGIIFSRSTTNIADITNYSHGEGQNAGPYVSISHENSVFNVVTNAAFPNYEENETLQTMSISINFACTDGTAVNFVLLLNIVDTNNNPPRFLPTDTYEFTITPPVPPGFRITGCLDDITVRDIDLTTERIDFTIEENPYFEIAYDPASSTTPKEFKAILSTKTLLRNISEPIQLWITATDVDRTDDPPITTTAIIRIEGDSEFQFPEEPIFSETFYLADYTTTHEVNLQVPISLRQGFHEDVDFTLDGGEHSGHFALDRNGNQLSITVTTPLSADTLREGQIFLIVTAMREFTSGATATVIVRLPEVVDLEFERALYEGTIIDNSLQPLELVLAQGYEDDVSVNILGEYSSFFTASTQANIITVTMAPLDTNIINENNFITIQVVASNDFSTASTVVTLDVIKDDNVTPTFDRPIYTGSYDIEMRVIHEQIVLVQGYDDTVAFTLDGEHRAFFELTQEGPEVKVQVNGNLPPHILSEHNLLLSVIATKPRTVGATAVLSIQLPAARELGFEESTYRGTIQDDHLLLQSIVLNVGYDDDVTFSVTGDFDSYFSVNSNLNQVTLTLPEPLPESAISEYNFLTLTLTAIGEHAVATSTTIVLEIIKEDSTTPLFEQNIYMGTVTGTSINIPSISLAQGYDDSVTFRLDGDHQQYFSISATGNNVALSFSETPIPEEVIFNEKVMVINILADKPLTVGANAAIAVQFPPELTDLALMRFSQNTYVGSIDELLTLEDIILETGFTQTTEFSLSGDHYQHFAVSNVENVITLSALSTLPTEVLENDKFILLELKAERERAFSVSTSILIDVVRQEVVPPIFSATYYRGVYTEETGLQFEEEISLLQGFDDTMTFELEGEHSVWFSLVQTGNSAQLHNVTSIPQEILQDNNQLLFTVVASASNTAGRAAISIDLPKEPVILRFTQNSYVGRIDNGELQPPTVTLLGENLPALQLIPTGDFAEHFHVTQESNNVIIELTSPLPIDVVQEHAFVLLDIEASYPNAISGYTTIIFDIVKEPVSVTPVFEHAYYIGEYSQQDRLIFEHSIQLIEGFDESVMFTIEGDHYQWFEIVHIDENNLCLKLRDESIEIEVEDQSHLVFSIVANKPSSIGGRAAVIINLSDFSTTIPLRFSENYYMGTIESGTLTIDSINLEEGYSVDIDISFTGDYVNYFQLTNQEGLFTLQLGPELPPEIVDANRVLVLTLEVQRHGSRTHTTIVIELPREEVEILDFDETFYVGTYSDELIFDSQMILTDGYDESVVFSLEGENSQWFGTNQTENSLSLRLITPIPQEVLMNHQHLIFVAVAEKPGSRTARATIIIELIDENDDLTILAFEKHSYVGSIENNVADIEPIILYEGFTDSVSFSLHGDLESYFTALSEGSTVTITLVETLTEDLIPENRIILLELKASAPESIAAIATVVFKVVEEDTSLIQLVFRETYYVGEYNEQGTFDFEDRITLTEGYDESIEFALEGENSVWFGLDVSENSVELTLTSPIPPSILEHNQQLIFVINAQRPSAVTARATIIITLVHETTILEFNRISYLGTIENEEVNVEHDIILSEGYSDNVSFDLHGDLMSYFAVSWEGATVTVALREAIPEELIPSSRIVVIEIQASAPETVSAFATIVFEVVQDNIAELIFSETYYTGYYTETEFIFENSISLTQGYDSDVELFLDGDDSTWFVLTGSENSYFIDLAGPIPPAVVINNQQFIFTIIAQRPGTTTTRATIVISLINEITETTILEFNRISYLGTIENEEVNIEHDIILSEGYSDNVSFDLHGDLMSYFAVSWEGATVTVALREAIPEELIPSSRIVVIEIQASAPETVSAFATIVFEVVQDNIAELIFSETYYTGYYTETEFIFENSISLTQGYDSDVELSLDGDDSTWFVLTGSENSYFIDLAGPIPPAVVINNQQFIFTIIAQRPGTTTTRATIVISLINENTASTILGFNRISYFGSVENDVVDIEQIILIEGYSDSVTFNLHGDLASYFTLSNEGATVTLALEGAIPDESIPPNRIVILDIQASAPETMSVFATIVFEVVQENISEMLFSETYYTGQYSEAEGVTLMNSISLTQGYDGDVDLTLEGDHSLWFRLNGSDNSYTLEMDSPIPPAVIISNQQLIFTISAQRPGATTIRSTIIIFLIDDFNESTILGFNRISYLGSIENDLANIEQIILSVGFTDDVSFTLHGGFENHFTVISEGPIVTVVLQDAIPEESIPQSRIVVLEIQASAPETMSAFATIVFEVVQENIPDLIFSEIYYVGQYTEARGIIFENTISLAQGYDSDVDLYLYGDHAIWFRLEGSDNSYTLDVPSPIPPAIIINNQQLIFTISAQRPGTATTRSTVVISLTDEITDFTILGFNRINYFGSIETDVANIEQIILSEGYTDSVSFNLHGDLSSHFALSREEATVTLRLQGPLPEELIPPSRIIILEIQASAPDILSAFATIVFEVIQEAIAEMIFNETYFLGHYTDSERLIFENTISLTQGYDSNVELSLEGDHAMWFRLNGSDNSYTLDLVSSIPPAVIISNQQLIFAISAQRPGTTTIRATIVIAFGDEITESTILGFNRINYFGSIESNEANIEQIILIEGYTDAVSFNLHGDLESYFTLSNVGPTVTLTLQDAIPEESIPPSRIIVLDIQASAPDTLSAFATIVIEVVQEILEELIFSEPYYTGHLTETGLLMFDDSISLTRGYDSDVQISLEGAHSIWFRIIGSENSYTLDLASPVPPAVIINNQKLIFIVSAQRPGSTAAAVRSTIILSLTDEVRDSTILGFNRINYFGSIENEFVNIEQIILSEGYTGAVLFSLHGDLASHFMLLQEDAAVTLALQSTIPEESIPPSRIIVLEIQASAPETISAFATIVFEVVGDNRVVIVFSETYYTGLYSQAEGFNMDDTITLTQGFTSDVEFSLLGENSELFYLTVSDNTILLSLYEPNIPQDVLENNRKLIFVLMAQQQGTTPARAVIIISLTYDGQSCSEVSFGKVLYEGIIQAGGVLHESISVSGYHGTDVEVLGEFAELFVATATDGTVRVQEVASVTLADDVSYVALELRVSDAGTVLLLDVMPSENPALPSVTFSSPSYSMRVDVSQTGLVGRVLATADNGESVSYSLIVDDAHLLQRISINEDGDIHLSAPAISGVYGFQVVATTAFTQVTGTAPVHLSVDAITICGEDDLVVPPLLILDRDEEEPHRDLVILDETAFEGCWYTLSNRWPINQPWLYVDEQGLHAHAINREDESIAFMTLSQIQVELTLECERDNEQRRVKRSLDRESGHVSIGPYNYGDNNWVLTDTILYNSRRTRVNLIVNDINDQYPIFDLKDQEPVTVGYPIPELEERVLPRALIELTATDADVGENAALRYWSSEDVLAVSPTTGFVHVRHNTYLADNTLLTVYATDRNGEGLTGSLQLMVKLLSLNHIAVVTVRDALLDDESTILGDLSDGVGYEVKALSSAVITHNTETTQPESDEENSRKNRDSTSATGASLQLYIYGLIQQEPVDVDRLTDDINNNAITTVDIASTLSLEDHLEALEICDVGRDTGLLIATIILSVLLFILIVAAAVWFFLKWWKKRKYQAFSDENSIGSRTESLGEAPKPQLVKPRLNIEELRKSEKRLKEMLEAPVEEVAIEPTTSKREQPVESVVDMMMPDPQIPIIIQSIDKLKDGDDSSDDEDEFGERMKSRRKSVVTFNENVEKIIHVEDDPLEDSSHPDYEVYKF